MLERSQVTQATGKTEVARVMLPNVRQEEQLRELVGSQMGGSSEASFYPGASMVRPKLLPGV
jgi:hypothetical protein